ncbi:MAG: hypothetical protein ACC634_09390, partial [Hyphomicrobiales bacterium]
MLRLEAMRCGYGPICAVSSLDLQVEPAQVFALIGEGQPRVVMANPIVRAAYLGGG